MLRAEDNVMFYPDTALAAQPFIGAWALESYTESSGTEKPVQPFGPHPVGFLIYTADGIVSAQLMRPNRKQLTTGTWDLNHSEGLAELAEGYIAYCGRYFIDEASGHIVHVPVLALMPNLIDQCQYRSFTFDDDKLNLRTVRTEANGKTIETRLVWRRHYSPWVRMDLLNSSGEPCATPLDELSNTL